MDEQPVTAKERVANNAINLNLFIKINLLMITIAYLLRKKAKKNAVTHMTA